MIFTKRNVQLFGLCVAGVVLVWNAHSLLRRAVLPRDRKSLARSGHRRLVYNIQDFTMHQLNYTGYAAVPKAAPSATCSRTCDSSKQWESLPRFRAFDISNMSLALKLTTPYLSTRAETLYEYVGSLRQHNAWKASRWPPNDTRQFECSYSCEISDAFVDADGHVCSLADNACFIQDECNPKTTPVRVEVPRNTALLPRYPHVLTISQFWGDRVYHAILEDAIKLVDSLALLQAHKNIYVHVPGNQSVALLFPPLLASLGIKPTRIISGPLLADSVIHPRGTACGDPTMRQLLKFRDMLSHSDCFCGKPIRHEGRPSILLVNREVGKPRSILNYKELRDNLSLLAEQKAYDLVEFNAPPAARHRCAIIQDMRVFMQSKVIVAPHGAGLSNLILCRPETIVLEIQTADVNYVFANMSQKIGLRHFIQTDKTSRAWTPMTANVTDIVQFLDQEL